MQQSFLVLSIVALTPDELGEQILSWFQEIGQSIVDLITAPFDALASIWSSWGDSLGTWYGPVLMMIVLIAMIILFYAGTWVLDNFLN